MTYVYFLLCCQIILESLPISSSTHLILFQKIIAAYTGVFPVLSESLYESVHLATVIIIVCYFFTSWWQMLQQLPTSWQILVPTFVKLFCICVLTAVLYVVWRCIPVLTLPLPVGMVITCGALFSLRWVPSPTQSTFWWGQLSWWQVIVLGVVQGCALQPGISRLASTYVAACWLGFAPTAAFELSCVIQLPLIAAASGRGLLRLYQAGTLMQFCTQYAALLMASATLVAYALLCLVARQAAHHTLWYWAWYIPLPFVLLCFFS